MHSGTASSRHLLLVTLTILLTAAVLRGPLVAIAPVAGEVGRALQVGPGFVGLLTSIPVLCFAVCAPVAVAVIRRAGADFALTSSIVGVVVGCVLRSVGGAPTAVAGTAVIGVSIAIGNIVVPVIVGREYPARQRPLMTGVYAAMLNAGTMTVTLTTVPVSAGLGWRWAIGIWGILGIAALGVWFRVRGPRTAATPVAAAPARSADTVMPGTRIPLTVWLLTVAFAGQAFSYYGLTAWLPSILGDQGFGAAQAGAISSIFQGVGIAGALLTPLVIRLGGIRLGAALVGLGWVALPIGFLTAPDWWPLWCSLGGLAQAGGFTVVLIVLTSLGAAERQSASWSGLVQGIGYAVAATGPATIGGLHEASGSWQLPLFLVVGSTVLFAGSVLVASQAATRHREAETARRSAAPPLGFLTTGGGPRAVAGATATPSLADGDPSGDRDGHE